MTTRVLIAAAALLLGGTSLVLAQAAPKPDEIIAARQAGMAMVGGIANLMKAGVESGVDPKVFEVPAAAMAKWGAAYVRLYPDGTQTGGNTKAKAEVWSDRAGFEKAATAFVAASTKLAEAAKSGDKAAFAAAFQAEGQSCGGCHRPYRAQ